MVHLERDAWKLARVDQSARANGFQFDWAVSTWPGVICRDHPEVVAHAVESGYMLDSGGARPGDVGAALAHITLWEHIAQQVGPDDIVLVMEDNVLFTPLSLNGTCDAIAAVRDFDYLNLRVLRPLGTPFSPDLGIRQITKEHKWSTIQAEQDKAGNVWQKMPNLWMSSYLVTGNGAVKLLRCLKREVTNYGIAGHVIDRVVMQRCLAGDESIMAFIVDHDRIFGHVETQTDSRGTENTARGCSYDPRPWRDEERHDNVSRMDIATQDRSR